MLAAWLKHISGWVYECDSKNWLRREWYHPGGHDPVAEDKGRKIKGKMSASGSHSHAFPAMIDHSLNPWGRINSFSLLLLIRYLVMSKMMNVWHLVMRQGLPPAGHRTGHLFPEDWGLLLICCLFLSCLSPFPAAISEYQGLGHL